MNYLDLFQLAFNQNPLKALVYSLPAFFLLFIGGSSMLMSFTKSYRDSPHTDIFDSILKAGNGTGMFISGFFILVLGIACIPKFNWTELEASQSKVFVDKLYSEKLVEIKKDSNAVFNFLKEQDREFKNFRQQVSQNIPTGTAISQKTVEKLFQDHFPIFLNCMDNKKNIYIKELETQTLAIEYIKEDVGQFAPVCSVLTGQYIVKNGIRV